MDDADKIEYWIKQLKNHRFDPGSSADQTIEKLVAAGPAAVRRLILLFAEGPANRLGWGRENLKAALMRVSLADPETFIASFPDVVMDESGALPVALGRIDDPRVERILTRVFWNPDPDPDRQYAKVCVVRALKSVPGPWVQRALIRALDYPKASLTRAVVQTLGAIGDEGALEPLKKYEAAHAGEPFKLAEEAARAIDQIRERAASGPPSIAPVREARELSETDRLIEMLGGEPSECETALRELEKLGEPALHRLFQANEGGTGIPIGRWPIDGITNRSVALGRLGRLYPEVLLGLVQGKTYLQLGTIQGLGFTGDERLKAIAREALKVFGDDI